MNTPASWSTTLKRLLVWAQGDEPLNTAHVQGPCATGKGTVVPLWMWNELAKVHEDQLVVFVTWDDEVARIGDIFDNNATDGAAHLKPAIWDYHRLLAVLRNNMRRDDTTRWADGPQPEAWINHGLFPERALLILDLVPQMPIEFCLSMAILSRLAFHRSGKPSSRLRILTMSSTEQLKPVASLFARDPWTAFRLKAEGTCNAEGYNNFEDMTATTLCAGQQGVMAGIKERIDASPDGSKHLVMFFEESQASWTCTEELGAERCASRFSLGNVPGAVPNLLRDKRLISPADTLVTVYKLPHASFSGVRVDGAFTHAHVVCSQARKGFYYNLEYGNVVQGDIPLSASERLDVVSWAARATRDGVGLALLYAVDGRDSRYTEKRLEHDTQGEFHDAVGRHAIGLLFSLIQLAHQGLDIDPVACMDIFTSTPTLVRELVRRLAVQGLVHATETLQRISCRLQMPGDADTIASRMMPVVGYDYRLAVLLATPSPHPGVACLKAQMAAALCYGPLLLFKLEQLEAAVEKYGSVRVRNELEGEFEGHSKPLALTGVWWTIISLMHASILRGGVLSGFQLRLDRDRFDVHRQPTDAYEAKFDQVRAVLTNCGVEVESHNDKPTLTPAHYTSLHGDVFTAFMYHGVLATGPDEHGAYGFYGTATQAEVVPDPLLHALVDMDKFRDQPVLGVSTSFHVTHSGAELRDWTGIPARAISERMQRDYPEWELSDILDSSLR
jgi:hypothetical protein